MYWLGGKSSSCSNARPLPKRVRVDEGEKMIQREVRAGVCCKRKRSRDSLAGHFVFGVASSGERGSDVESGLLVSSSRVVGCGEETSVAFWCGVHRYVSG